MVWYVGGIAIGVVLIIALVSVAVRGRPRDRSGPPSAPHGKKRRQRSSRRTRR
jgi:hypothetical protein